MGNSNLHRAKKEKNDEFYTQLSDIEKEVENYRDYFKGKHVFLNCDDPEESMFWKYFEMNFELFELKQLTATHYHSERPTYRLDIKGDLNGDGKIDGEDIIKTPLKQNGDFRSEESIAILKECDIVVTNPPFSLFREYIAQLIEYGKDFLVVGHQNAITFNEVLPNIVENKLWLGTMFKGRAAHFINKHYTDYATATNHIDGMIRVSGVQWFTNMDHKKRHEDIVLYETYTPEKYPKYDTLDAINVNKTKEIPKDYYGLIGVPITFLTKYSPGQFEIIGKVDGSKVTEYNFGKAIVNGKAIYKRLLIKRKVK